MISKKDVENYLKKMMELEFDMHDRYEKLSLAVKDEELKKKFIQLSKDETGHAKLVKELQGLLKKWK